MNDIVLETVRALILLGIFVYLLREGRKRVDLARNGWSLLMWGFGLLLFGTILDITDNFPALDRFVVVGDTAVQAVLEKLVGYLGGYLLLAVGLVQWIPTVTGVGQLQRVNSRLTEHSELVRRSREQLALRRAELERANAELARSNRELEQFAYVASHDLREPLRAVSSFCDLLKQRYGDRLDADGEEFIDFAVDGARRMDRLLADLLAYSRVSTHGHDFESVSCEDALAAALANLRSSIEESGAEITHDPLPDVQADATQLVQLFQNLIGNAVKYRAEAAPRIHVGAVAEGDGWVLSFRDAGIGIDPRHTDRIFEVFQRLHTRDQYGGTGIGLAICKRIAERHDGRIWVESEPGHGSTFHVKLPAAIGVPAHAASA